jgi:hypothetical protein
MVVHLVYLVLNLLLHERLDRRPVFAVTKFLQGACLDLLLVDLVSLSDRVTACPSKLAVNDAQLLDLLEGAVDCSAALSIQDALGSQHIQ